ncbi:MAG: hypothetical protein PHR36_03870 [Patescibacteria group bacterium]|nr:hypothetical protein [Patescibacteria group bacterium]
MEIAMHISPVFLILAAALFFLFALFLRRARNHREKIDSDSQKRMLDFKARQKLSAAFAEHKKINILTFKLEIEKERSPFESEGIFETAKSYIIDYIDGLKDHILYTGRDKNFLLILIGWDMPSIDEIIKKIAVQISNIPVIGGFVSIYFGVSEIESENVIEEATRNSQLALETSINAGKNNVSIYAQGKIETRRISGL